MLNSIKYKLIRLLAGKKFIVLNAEFEDQKLKININNKGLVYGCKFK